MIICTIRDGRAQHPRRNKVRPDRHNPYPDRVTAAHDYELPPHSAAPAEAVDAASEGQVVYLTRNGRRIAAIVPANLAEHAEQAGGLLRQRLADAGLLAKADPLDTEPPDPAAVAAARRRAGRGRPLSEYLSTDR
jgi:antitoxin (DNA-binding transcriptional repressor) of toxin-antitoxin stability system